MRPVLWLLLMILLAMTTGCGSSDEQLRAWQQQQVETLQRQAEQNTATARALVEADARSRQELLAVQRELQTERTQVGRQRDALETERQSLANQRHRDPIIAAALHGLGTVALAALPLVACLLLLRNTSGADSAGELENLLILNLAGEERQLLFDLLLPISPAQRGAPALNDPAGAAGTQISRS